MTVEIDIDLADTIIENPIPFRVDDRRFFLYPVTLGKALLLSKTYKILEINDKLMHVNPYAEAMRLVESKREDVCRIIAYQTLKAKKQILNIDVVQERVEFFSRELDIEDLTQLLILSMTGDKMQDFIKRYGFAEEKKMREMVARVKEKTSKGGITFGGKTVYGLVIDWACERYGWTMDYVLWGISYINLRMLMQDAINCVSLTKEERAKAGIYDNDEILNAEDPRNWDAIREMLNN